MTPASHRPASSTLETTTDAGFAALGVPSTLVAVLDRGGITTPFPIQTATLPDSLSGRDVLGRGRTGSGKTLAFALPLVAHLSASSSRTRPTHPRGLVLVPTRELANQVLAVVEPLATAAGLTTMTIFGGVGQNPQVRALRAGPTSSSPAPDAWRTSSARATATSVTSRSPSSTRPTTWLTSASCRASSD